MSYLLAYNPYNTNLFMKTRSIDPAAQDFIDAAGITGDVQQQAINNLVKGLKADGLWSKMKAVYPFVTDNRNLLGYTEDFGNAYWSKDSATIKTPNYAAAPDGTMTACRVYNGGYLQTGAVSVTLSQQYTVSFYMKTTSGNTSTVRLFIDGGANTSTKTITGTWTRVSATLTANVPNSTFGFFVDSSDVLIWHPQGELGSTATTYQPILTTQQAYIAAQFKFNLKDPRDSDAAFRLVFNGGWTFDKTGATPNGTNGYADTKLNIQNNLNQDSIHLSYYSRTNSNATEVEIGAQSGAFQTLLELRTAGTTYFVLNQSTPYVTYADVDSRAFYIANRTASNVINGWRNSTKVATGITVTIGEPNLNLYIGANNVSNTATYFSIKQTAFSTIGDGLTDDDAAALYYHTQVFQTSLNRQIGSPAYAVPVVTDPNAKLYLSAIGSTTNSTFNTAIDTFIKGLKADGIYSKMKAIYPFATNNPNLLNYTENLNNNIFWNNSGSTVIANNAIAPDGSNTAWRVTRINTLAQGFALRQNIATITAGLQYTFSVYLKAPDLTTTIQVDLGDSVPNPIITLTTEWRLYTFVRVMGGSGAFIDFNIASGDGSYCWFWHPQLEIGSTATAYQAQLGSAQSYFANQFKYNMVNPQDDDSAFRLVFNGGWTHSPQGALPNGVNAYADTKLIPSSVLTLNSGHLSFYSRTDSQSGIDIGGQNDNQVPYAQMYLASRSSINLLSVAISSTDATRAQSSNTSSLGLFLGSRISSTSLKSFKNSVLQTTNTSASQNNQPNFSLLISALQYSPSPINYSNHQAAFSSIGDGLTDTEAANLFVRVETLNRALARQVVVPTVSDPDAQAFLINAVITDPTQATAINNLVVGLKADGLWDKMKAIYPFVGGTASTHKYNLKDPRDLDAAYRLVFNGGWTHDANGATPNGVNAYADTKLIAQTNMFGKDYSIGYYSRTNSDGIFADIGNFGSGSSESLSIYTRYGNLFYLDLPLEADRYTISNTTSLGYFISNNATSVGRTIFNNLSKIAGVAFSNNNFPVNINPNIVLSNSYLSTGSPRPSNRQLAFANFGTAFTDTETTNLYIRIQAYQTALNRQIP